VGKIFKLKRKFYNQSGQVAVMVALLLTALVGMLALVVDVGSMYDDRSSLQGVADAAALTGAKELPGTSTDILVILEDFIDSYNTTNGTNLSVDIIDLQSFPLVGGVPNTMLTVTVTNPDSPIYFGNAVPGFARSSVAARATATAVVGSPVEYPAVPWGLLDAGDKWFNFNSVNPHGHIRYGEPITLLYRELTDIGPDNYVPENYFDALDIGGSGDPIVNYENAIVNGTSLNFTDQISISDDYLGNVSDETYNGVERRVMQQPPNVGLDINLDPDLLPYPIFTPTINPDDSLNTATLERGDSQLVIIPVIGAWPHATTTILYFLPFVITDCELVEALWTEDPDPLSPSYGVLTDPPVYTRAVKVTGVFLSEAYITTNGEIRGLDYTHLSETRSIIKVVRLVKNPE
jgi:Flp pilus assembly protein TadG